MSQLVPPSMVYALVWPALVTAAAWALAVWALRQDGDLSHLVRRFAGDESLAETSQQNDAADRPGA